MNELEKTHQASLLISKHFGISQSEFNDDEEKQLEHSKLLKELTRVIRYLLDNDFQKLLNGLYIIDVNQQKVSEILEIGGTDNLAIDIAKLVIEREMQKVETRLKYRNNL